MPTFLIVGAARSGTTALYDYLAQHPDVFMSPVKEPHFFAYGGQGPLRFTGPGDDASINRVLVTDQEAYQRLFAGGSPARARGEASVSSLYVPRAAGRIAELAPGAKLVVMLRDPVERAHASYLYLVSRGVETESFEQALELEERRQGEGWQHIFHYAAMGHYGTQLENLLSSHDRDRLHVVLYDDFRADPERSVGSVLDFLDLPPFRDFRAAGTAVRRNRSGLPRIPWLHRLLFRPGVARAALRGVLPAGMRRAAAERFREWGLRKPEMSSAARTRLKEEYRLERERVEGLLGRRISSWQG